MTRKDKVKEVIVGQVSPSTKLGANTRNYVYMGNAAQVVREDQGGNYRNKAMMSLDG